MTPLRPLMSAAMMRDELGIPLRQAENMFHKIARDHGGPVEVTGKDGDQIVRSVFVERAWVEAALGQRAS